MSIKFRLNDAKFQRALKKFYAASEKDRAEIMKAQARLVAVNLAFQTAPFGKDKAAKLRGEGSAQADINRVYKGPAIVHRNIWNSGQGKDLQNIEDSRQAAAAFVRLVRDGKTAEAEKLLQDLRIDKHKEAKVAKFDAGVAVKAARHGTRKKVSRNQFVQLVPTDFNSLKKFARQVQQRVGLAKAGWASAAKWLGGMRDIPAWVQRHVNARALSSLDDQSSRPYQPFIKITNMVPYVSRCISPDQIQRALDIQKQKMIRAINIASSKAAKASGL
jgi:hypothetical protein